MRCFARSGVLRVGIEDIRREAGASPSSVYHQFANIDAIVLALLVRIFASLFEHLARRVGRTRTAEGAVRALVDGHIEWIADHPAEGRFMYEAMTLDAGGLSEASRGALAAEKQRLLAPVTSRIGAFVARGELPDLPPELLDVILLGPAHEALRRHLSGGAGFSPDRLRKILPGIAWKSVAR